MWYSTTVTLTTPGMTGRDGGKMKRKLAALFIVTLLASVLAGCQNSDIQKKYEELSEKYDELQNEYDSLSDDYDSLSEDYDSLLTDYATMMAENDISSKLKESDNGSKQGKSTNQQTKRSSVLCYDDEFVTIYYSHCEPFYDEYNIVLIAVNKTDVDITVGLNSFSVDGWNLSDAFCFQDIARKSEGYVKISTEELQTDSPRTIGGTLYIADTSETLFGELMRDVSFNVSVS